MADRAPDVARALAEGEMAFHPLPDLPRRLRERWPDLTRGEMERGVFIAIECGEPTEARTAAGPVITDMRRIEPRPNPSGTVLVARFACRVGGLKLLGVKLVRRSDGTLAVNNVVSGGGERGTARGVVFEDEGLRAVVLAAAAAVLGEVAPLDLSAPRRHRGRRASGR